MAIRIVELQIVFAEVLGRIVVVATTTVLARHAVLLSLQVVIGTGIHAAAVHMAVGVQRIVAIVHQIATGMDTIAGAILE